jgi:hypothetical protein
MRRMCKVVLTALGLIALVGSGQAFAAPALLAIDDAAPTLEREDDGDWSGTLGLTNLTDGALSLSVAPVDAGDRDCKLELSRAAIGAAQSSEPKLIVPKTCDATEHKLELTLTATGDSSQRTAVAATLQEGEADPDWSQLAAFFYAIPAVAVALLGVAALMHYELGQPLEYLDATWSFKDSWVSNVTVVASVLTALFGSGDVVKAFLGEDADRSIALATVGSAIALILIGSGPIILAAAKKEVNKDDGALVQAFTVGGLLAATTVTVAGAFGELWVGWKSGEALDLDGWENRIEIGFWIAVALLAWYALSTIRATLKAGTTPPPHAKPSELAQLIAVLKEALTKNRAVPDEEIPSVLKDVFESYPTVGTSFGDEPRVAPRRHAAML